MLSLDLPPIPLFKDTDESIAIPKKDIRELLNKYGGKEVVTTSSKRNAYKIRDQPRFLIFSIKRFVKLDFNSHKNPTVVTCP